MSSQAHATVAAPADAGALDRLLWAVPPPALMMIGMISFQVGAAFSKDLFDRVSAPGVSFLRVAFGALFLFLIMRPSVRTVGRAQFLVVLGMGGSTAAMSLLYFVALQRIPLGIATAVAFSGPFILAMSGAKRLDQLIWVVVAASGVVLLAPWGASDVDPVGFLLAALAGATYTFYVIVTRRAGQSLPKNDALPLAMGIAAVLLAPVGVASAGADLIRVDVLIIVALTAILSNVLPYILEFNALKRVSAAVYAVLISLDPAVSAVAGLIILSEQIGTLGYVAIGLICVGSIFANRAHNRAARPAPGEI
jgi:inner membrane transporter RhtA